MSSPKKSGSVTVKSPEANDDSAPRTRGRPKKDTPVIEESTPEPRARNKPKKYIDTPIPGKGLENTPVKDSDNTESKGRGRPKKIINTPTSTVERGKGRPRKEENEEQEDDENTPDDSGGPKRGRGRPRKDENEDATNDKIINTPLDESTGPKKGRGRPRKDENEEAESSNKNNDDVSSEKKVRGRPRKSIGEGQESMNNDKGQETKETNVKISTLGPGLVEVKIEPDDTFHMSTRRKQGFCCTKCGQTFSVQYLLEDHELKCKKADTPMLTPKSKAEFKQKSATVKTNTPKSKISKEKEKPKDTPKRKPELKASLMPKNKQGTQPKESDKIQSDSELLPEESEKRTSESDKMDVTEDQEASNDTNKSDQLPKSNEVETEKTTAKEQQKTIAKSNQNTPKTVTKAVAKTTKDQTNIKKVEEKKLQLVVTPEGLKRTREERPAVLKVEKTQTPRSYPYSRSLLTPKPNKPTEKKVVIVMGEKETEVSIEGTGDIPLEQPTISDIGSVGQATVVSEICPIEQSTVVSEIIPIEQPSVVCEIDPGSNNIADAETLISLTENEKILENAEIVECIVENITVQVEGQTESREIDRTDKNEPTGIESQELDVSSKTTEDVSMNSNVETGNQDVEMEDEQRVVKELDSGEQNMEQDVNTNEQNVVQGVNNSEQNVVQGVNITEQNLVHGVNTNEQNVIGVIETNNETIVVTVDTELIENGEKITGNENKEQIQEEENNENCIGEQGDSIENGEGQEGKEQDDSIQEEEGGQGEEEDEDIVDEGAIDGKRKHSDDETWTPKTKRRRKIASITPATAGKGKKQPKNTISLLSEAAKKTLEKAKEENKELDPVQLKIFESLMSVVVKEDENEEANEENPETKIIKEEVDDEENPEENDVSVIMKDEEALVDISVIESMVDLESSECAICFMKFKNAKYMRNHLVTHTGNKRFTCTVCHKRFMRKYDLQQHMMRVHSFIKAARGKIISSEEELLMAEKNKSGILDCMYCGTQFTGQFMLDSHLEENHSDERPFECEICKARFPTSKKLIRHKDTVHSQRHHQCEQCDKSFRFLYALKEHEKTHDEAKPFLCDFCGKGFALAKYLQKHKQRHNAPEMVGKIYNCRYCEKSFDNLHEYQQHIRTHTEVEDRVHQCDRCPKRFFKHAHLKRHILTHSTVRCYQCEYCEKTYKDPDTLRKHIRFIHKPPEEDANRKEYPCPFCDKVFYSNGHRKRHLIKHTGDRPFKCDKCNKGFTEKRSLQNHKRIHSGERPYSCKICGKAFIQLSHLNRHTFLHTQIRNFECDECGKKFFENADLVKHQRIHSNDKPYKCEFCGMGFSQQNILKCHRRRHTGEKPYVCDICNRAFIQMGALQTHRRLHTGERPFKCSYCGQGFVSKERMKFHTYIHTGITPHICHICGKGFRLKFKYQSHLDSHEGVYRYQCKICNKGFLEKTKLNRHIKQIHDDPTNPDTETYIENNIRIIQHAETLTPKYQIVELHPEEDETTTHVIVEDDTLRNFSEIAVNSMQQPAANEEVIETTTDVQTTNAPAYEIQTTGAEGTNSVQHIQFDAESGEITTTGGTTLFDGTTTINLPEGIIYEGMENGEEVVYVVIPEDNQTVILS